MKHAIGLIAAIVVVISITTASAQEIEWEAAIPTEQIREDFAALYSRLKSAHADLFAQRSKSDYDARYEAMLTNFTKPMSRFEVQLSFQRFAAFGNVAHARIEFPNDAYATYQREGGRTLPIFPRIVEGIAYVGQNVSGNERVQAGDEIVAINGTPMTTWLTRTAQLISADTPYIAHSLLEFQFPQYLWAVAGEVAQFELTLRREGNTLTLTVPATTRDAQRAAAATLPETFALDISSRSYRMIDERIGYLRPGPFYNVEDPTQLWSNEAFIAFIDQAFGHFTEADAKALIIDLRQNPGGDNSFSDAMLSWIADKPFRFYSQFLIRSSDEAAASNAARLKAGAGGTDSVSAMFARQYERVPRGEVFPFDLPYAEPRSESRFEGHVYALVNRHSYSNAVNVAAIIQDYNLGTIVGEKTADMATTYGSMETFRLPNTGIDVGFPKSHIIRPSGDRVPDGVAPEWVIESPIVTGAHDAVLDALVQRLRTR